MATSALLLLTLTALCVTIGADTDCSCNCKDAEHCTVGNYAAPSIQVIATTQQRSSTYQFWDWEHINLALSTGDIQKDLMCYAHSKNKKYGVIVKAQVNTNFFTTTLETNKTDNSTHYETKTNFLWWISKNVVQKLKCKTVDVLTLDMLDLLKHPGNLTGEMLGEFIQDVHKAIIETEGKPKLICVLPWEPVCIGDDKATQDCDIITSKVNAYCDYYMTSPDSFLDYTDGSACKARATVPFTKLVLGIDEYMSKGLNPRFLIVGIPWHGYDYTCTAAPGTTQTCKLPPLENTTRCDLSGRKKRKIGELLLAKPIIIEQTISHEWSDIYFAPYYFYMETVQGDSSTVTHQVWFEDIRSLIYKYIFVKDMQLAGVSIWYADDLQYNSSVKYVDPFDKQMWGWVKHNLFGEGMRRVLPKDCAVKVAGASVGCLILGLVVGLIVAYFVFVRCKTSYPGRLQLKPPFLGDHEFRDEDPLS